MPRRFVDQRRRDPFYRAAQRDGLRSRAAFKLAQLAEGFPIFRVGARVLDLGAAPGGWALIAQELVGPRGEVVAVDVRRMDPIPGVRLIRARVGDPQAEVRLGDERFDVILSDMSPSISGAYATDHARSVELAGLALTMALHRLRQGGSFVAKVFAGDLLEDLEARGRPAFERWRRTKPTASRAGSSEMYVLGLGYQAPRPGPALPVGPETGPARPDRPRSSGSLRVI